MGGGVALVTFTNVLKNTQKRKNENGRPRAMNHGSSMSPCLLGRVDGDGLRGKWGSKGKVVGDCGWNVKCNKR